MSDKGMIAEFIANFCMTYPSKPVLGKLPGARYKGQYYMAKAMYNTDFLKAVTREFHDRVKAKVGHFNFQIAGREWSACPLLTAIPIYMESMYGIRINSFLIKSERKTYGMNNYIEGMPNNLPVLIVDDMLNSTPSFLFCYNVLKSEGKQPLPFIFAIANKHGPTQGEQALKEDRFMQGRAEPIYIVNGDEIHAAKR